MHNLNQHFPLVNAPVKPRQVRVVIDHDFSIPIWLQTLAETVGLFVMAFSAFASIYLGIPALIHLVSATLK